MAHKNKNLSSNSNPAGKPFGLPQGSDAFGSLPSSQSRTGRFNQPAGYRGKNTPINPAANWRRFNP